MNVIHKNYRGIIMLIRTTLFFAFAFSLLIINSCSDSTTEPLNNISVTGLIENIDGNPIGDAMVEATDTQNKIIDSDITDDDGLFLLENLPSDFSTVNIKISKEGFLTYHDKLSNLTSSKEKKIKAQLLDDDTCCGVISITVKDRSDSSSINDAEVRLNLGERVIEKLYSSYEDPVIFDSLCPDEYWVRIAKEGYRVIEESTDVEDCDTLEFTFWLESNEEQDTCCDGILYVTPRDSETNEIITGAVIKLWQGGNMIEKATVGESYAVIDNICEGTYWIDIIHEQYQAIEFEVEFDCDETKEISRELDPKECCDGVLRIFVKDSETEESLNGSIVKLWKDGNMLTKKTVENGSVLFTGLCEGNYGVDILNESYQNIEFLIELDCDDTLEITKYLEANECCHGRVYVIPKDSETEEVINGAKVRLWQGGTKIREVIVQNGYAVLEEICEGNYGVSILHEEYDNIEFELEVGCDDTLEVVRFLDPDCCNGLVKVFVKDSETEENLNSASVTLRQNGETIETLTVQEGRVVFDGVCEGNYEIAITKEGYTGQEFDFEIGCSKVKEFVKLLVQE
jgi:hypothetical protein